MNSQYDVQVRMSTVGTSEISSNIKNVGEVLGAMQQKLNQADDGTRRLSATFRQTTADGEKYSITMRQLAASQTMAKEATDGHANSMDRLSGLIGRMVIGMVAYRAIFAVVDGIKSFVAAGTELNALLETSQLGIAATILSYRDYKDEQGKVIVGQRAMSLAMAEGAHIQKLLQGEAFNTTATLEQMLKAYQALQVGAATQKVTSQQLATFTATLGNLATATGRSFEELSAQTSRVLQGVLTIRNPIAALLRGMGVDNETIKSWVRQGTAVEEIQKRLVQFMAIGPEINKTWAGVLSNVKDVTQQLGGAIMAPLMDSIKNVGLGFVSMFTDTFQEGERKVTRFKESVRIDGAIAGEALRLAFESSIEVIQRVWTVFTVGAGSSRDIVTDIATKMAYMKSIIGDVAEGLALMSQISRAPAKALLATVSMGTDAAIAGDINTAKKQFEEFKALGARIKDFVTELQSDEHKAEVAAKLAEDLFKIRAAGLPASPDMSPGMGDARKPPPSKALEDAMQAYLTKTEQMQNQATASVEKGLDKQLLLIEAESDKEIALAGKKSDELIKLGANVYIAQEMYDERRQASLEAMYGKELAAFQKRMQLDDEGLERQQKRTEENNAWYLSEAEKLYDELAAVSLDYYTREQGKIDKQADNELKVVEQRRVKEKLTNDQYLDLVISVGKLYDAKKALNDLEEHSIVGMRKKWEEEIKLITMTTNSIEGGLKAGWLSVMLTMRTTTESVRDFVLGVWNQLGQAFETGVYDVLTGKFSDLGNVLKSLWDGILKDFSKMLTQMLQRWILTGDAMTSGEGSQQGGVPKLIGSLLGASGQTAYQNKDARYEQQAGFEGPVSQRGAGGGAAMGLIGGAVGFGTAIATGVGSNQQPYTIAGQQYTGDFGGNAKFGDFVVPALMVAAVALAAGGTALTLAGVTIATAGWTGYGLIAAAVILLVGAVISMINGPEEARVSLGLSQMSQRTPIGNAMRETYGATMGSLRTTSRAGGGSPADFSGYAGLDLSGWNPYIHAGSGDDLTKDAENFFKVVLPRLAIEGAFGQKWTGHYNEEVGWGRSIPGASKVPMFEAGSFDPEAPIPKMLAGLGMTAKTIRGIALQIDLKDPAQFLEWLGRIVNVSVGFKATIANLNKSWVDVQADTQKANWHGGYNPLRDASQNVIDLAGEIGGYVGEAQLAKMEELQKASDAYFQSAAAALKVLTDMMNSVTTDAADFSNTVAQVGKNSDWLRSDRTNRLGITGGIGPGGQYGPELANDSNVDAVKVTWDAFMKDANDQLNFLIGVLNQVNAGLAAMKGFATDFDNIFTAATRNPMDWDTINSDWQGLQQLIRETGGIQDKNSTQYLANLGLIQQGTQNLYQETLAFIQAINTAQSSLDQGVTGDIWQNTYMMAGNNDTSGNNSAQIQMIQNQVTTDLGKISTATDPTQVTALAGEIRGLLHTYQGFFKPGDVGYNAAFLWSNQVLGQLRTTGTTALTGMGASAGALAAFEGTGGAGMQTSQALFQTALDVATTSIGTLKDAVDLFAGDVKTKLIGWADNIEVDMKAAAAALTLAMNDFTTALGGDVPGAAVPPKGNPKRDLQDLADSATAAVGDETGGLVAFTKAVNTATAALTGGA